MTTTTRCPESWAPTHMERCALDAGHLEDHSPYAANGCRGGWQPITTHHTKEHDMSQYAEQLEISTTPSPAATLSVAPTTEPAPGRRWLDLANATPDPFECMAMALTGLLEVAVVSGESEAQADDQSLLISQLDTELQEALGERDGTLAAVRAALGKSTSQVAEKVRAALGDASAKAEPSGEPTHVEQPDRDDDIETWRAYGRSQGIADVEELNRSQIRTALGVPNA